MERIGRTGKAGTVREWHGLAGLVRQGAVWLLRIGMAGLARLGLVRSGSEWRGVERKGRRGRVRFGKDRNGLDWLFYNCR